MKNRFVSLACVVLAMSGVLGAETASAQDAKALTKDAVAAVANEDWNAAIKNYTKLTEMDSQNPEVHSALGKCYLQAGDKVNAIAELQKAQSLYNDKQKAKDAVQYEAITLAHALKETGKVDDAIKTLEALQPKSKTVQAKVAKELNSCKVAKDIMDNPKDNMVLNLGAFVNADFADHSAILSNDKKQLIFTSRRELAGHSKDSIDNEYDENVFVSSLVDSTKTFGAPVAFEGEINTNEHDAVCAISPDGNELYIYNGGEDNGTIYVCKKNGNSWGTPERLNDNINTPYMEKGVALSPDGSKLYFSSDRPGTMGGLDIFVSERQGDNWGPAKNLGAAINTEESEEGAYVSKDGSTLYFSSRGHDAIGGYDIFKASINGDSFGTVENLGTPINSVSDEFYAVQEGQKIYFSSNRGDGQGSYDLYVAGPTSVMKTAATVFNGKVKVCQGDMIPSEITLIDNSDAKKKQTITPSADGSFSLNTFRGHNYSMSVMANGKEIYSLLFDVAVDAPAERDFFQTIQLDPENECKPEEVIVEKNPYEEDGVIYDFYVEIEDITFAFAKADPLTSNENLDKLAQYLKDFPKAQIEVKGYADAQGSSSLNYTLARKRALTAQSYLTKKGVKSSQIKVTSLGEENPLSYNLINGEINEASKKFNRRLEFKMLKQGEKTMLIRAIRNIPEQYKNPDYNRDYVKKSGMPETNI